MILQALKEYYDRKQDLPRFGFELKEIPYIIVLKSDGSPVNLAETFEGIGKNRRAKQFLVPQAVKRSVGIVSNTLWDNPEYVLGIVCKGKAERVAEQHAAFVKRVDELAPINDEGLSAIRSFLSRPHKIEELAVFGSIFEELIKAGANLSFQLAGNIGLILERPSVQASIAIQLPVGSSDFCLVTGSHDPSERLHAAIKGVWGAQSSGANIVSFNLDAFRSYKKEQGYNAPIGKRAAFAYTTALNHLLSRTSNQRIQIGDASTVFWAQKADPLEELFPLFFIEPPRDDPDRNIKAVENLFKAAQSGIFVNDESKCRFYVLGLAPNASRISVRFWFNDTVGKMAENIRQHFADVRIVHSTREKDVLSLFRLLISTASQGKSENIIPNLSGDLMRAILKGLPYPQTLLQAAIRRIRSDHEISYPRAALIKAFINRATRFRNPKEQEEIHMSLDTSNLNIGYRLGRLFATLEKIQSEANPGINATIRDRFYGAASSTPVTVFGNLMRLKNHHLAKIDFPGRRITFEKLISEIVSSFCDFPAHLRLDDQGRFAIGYYHQMQDFFTKKDIHQANKEEK